MKNYRIFFLTFILFPVNLLLTSCSKKQIVIIEKDEVYYTTDSGKFHTKQLSFSYTASREGYYKKNDNKYIFYSILKADSTYRCEILNSKQNVKESSAIIINSEIPSVLFELIIKDTLESVLYEFNMSLEDVLHINKTRNIVNFTIIEKNLGRRVFNLDRISLSDTIIINALTTTYVDTFHIDTIDISKLEKKQTKDTIFYFR